jgi:hypothetical protein
MSLWREDFAWRDSEARQSAIAIRVGGITKAVRSGKLEQLIVRGLSGIGRIPLLVARKV